MGNSERADGLDLEGLTELEVRCRNHTQEELGAAIAAMHQDDGCDFDVRMAMDCIWWCHTPMVTDYDVRRIISAEIKILEYIFGNDTDVKLLLRLRRSGQKDPAIGKKLVAYAKEHGFVKELPDELREIAV